MTSLVGAAEEPTPAEAVPEREALPTDEQQTMSGSTVVELHCRSVSAPVAVTGSLSCSRRRDSCPAQAPVRVGRGR